MRRYILPLLLALITLSVQANTPFSLDRRLNPFGQQSGTQTTVAQWQEQHEKLKSEQQNYQQIIDGFPKQKAKLVQQVSLPAAVYIDSSLTLDARLQLVHYQLKGLKQKTDELRKEQAELPLRISQLPQHEAQAQTQLEFHSAISDEQQQARHNYFSQLIITLQTEQKALPLKAQLLQLEERVAYNQQLNLEQQLASINEAIAAERRAQSETVINNVTTPPSNDPELQALAKSNNALANELDALNQQVEQTGHKTVELEQRYQQLSIHQKETQEQLKWGGANAEFGESLLKKLKQLNIPTAQTDTNSLLNQSRLSRYDYEQQQALLHAQLSRLGDKDKQLEPLKNQDALLSQLISTHEQWVVSLSQLKLQQEQLITLSDRYRQLITEHLFWLPNTRPLQQGWLREVGLSLRWLLDSQRVKELHNAYQDQQFGWSLWLVLLVAVIALFDLLKKPFANALAQQARYLGNVTLDKFSASMTTLLLSIGYSLLPMLPVWTAAYLLYSSDGHAFAQALGYALFFAIAPIQLYGLLAQLCRPDGLITAHFRRYPPLVQQALAALRRLLLVITPLIILIVLANEVSLEVLKASLGRGAFLILCVILLQFYRQVKKFAKEYHYHHSGGEDPKQSLIEQIIWLALIVVPALSFALAIRGYYYSGLQVLSQAQITVLLALLYMIGYLMVKRWTLIERRRLQFERAKAKRAEALALRERGDSLPTSNEGQLDGEEPLINLDTISTQSLTLIRSLLVLTFFMSLFALWSQTHSAMFSFLEGITLWSTVQNIDGLDQTVPITLMSLATALVFAVFTVMIARNLPGLLELALLQRLDLSPGTGFAITSVTKYLIYTFGLFATFSMLGLAWDKLQWLVAALTFGLAFGLQEIFANFISGIIILFEKPIRIGDTVTIRDLTGTVSKIQIRATTIVDWDRKEIIVPNKAFITEQLVNWSLSDPITRIIMKVSVARDSDPALVEALLHQAVKESSFALEQPEPEIFFNDFGPHTQNFELRAYADEMAKRWPLRHDLHMRIIAKFREAGVVLAYPQMDLHIKSGETKDVNLIR